MKNVDVAHWTLSIFSRTSDTLLREIPVPGVDPAETRALWGLSMGAPVGALPITATELPFLIRHLEAPYMLDDETEAFLELVRDEPGEVITDADGTSWYPPP